MTAILVADDSQTVRMDLADTFEAAGFLFDWVSNVEQTEITHRALFHAISDTNILVADVGLNAPARGDVATAAPDCGGSSADGSSI